MKKNLFFAAVALVALASCSNEEIIGDSPTPNPEKASNAIVFNTGAKGITRAGDLVGADAAEKLQNEFIVFGTKHASDEDASATNDEVVFKNYVVQWTNNSAGKTLSNTHNWEYVGITPYATGKVDPAISGDQAIKYWDFSAASGYTFYAIASKADITTGNVVVDKIEGGETGVSKVYDKGYSVTIKSTATLNNLFVADRKPVAIGDYQKPVLLTFRNFAARVRVGFYETIPGYSVKIDNFYTDDAANSTSGPALTFAAMDDAKTSFAASLQNINTAADNDILVSYYDDTDTDVENHVKISPATSGTNYNYSLTLGSGVVNTVLATSSATPTWDTPKTGDPTVGEYTPVLPFEQNTNPMLVKVDYTLTALDGSNETIKVTGANVVVPANYVQWRSNFAYTYIFKISDNSNGYTGPTDKPAGLFPITFDAAVISVADDKTQETITNFEDYSITTYANGSTVTSTNEYAAGEPIYIVKTNNTFGTTTPTPSEVVAPSAIGVAAGNAQVFKVTTTPGADAVSDATIKAALMGAPNGITLTAVTGTEAASLVQLVPAADDTNYDFGADGAVKFTPSAAGTYVYVFTRVVNVPTTYNSAAATYSSSATYYFKTSNNVYFVASGINEGNFASYNANLYTVNVAGTVGQYDTKMILVK